MAKVAIVLIACLLLVGCADSKVLEGKQYPPYGLFDAERNKSAKVCYDVSIGNIILSVIFFETVAIPVILVGWYLYEPAKLKSNPQSNCTIDERT